MIRNRSSFCPATLKSIAALSTLALGIAACDSGTQEPAAPTPAVPEATTEEAAPAAESAAAPAARQGDIDPSRFPSELPEGVTAAVPDNFPSDVPIYPGSQPAQGKGIAIEGSAQSAVQLLTNDAYGDVHRFYSDKLQSGGWTISEDTENEAAATIQASKDKCKASILVTPAAGGGSDIFIVTEC